MSRPQVTVVVLAVLLVLGAGGYLGYRVWDQGRDHRTYPASVRDDFLVGCASGAHGGATDAGCRCAFDWLESRFELSEFTQLASEFARTGEVTGPFVEAAAHCGVSLDTVPSSPPTSVDHSTVTFPAD